MTLNMTMNYIIDCNFLYVMTSLYYSWTSCPQRLLSVDTEAIKVGHTSKKWKALSEEHEASKKFQELEVEYDNGN